MKITGKSGNFEPCPDYHGQAVCVDVTPLKKMPSQYGEREVFKVVFEVAKDREDGTRYCVWSKPFTPSLNDKANFKKFLRQWFGRDLTPEEAGEFETENLIGKGALLTVVQEYKEGETYANIVACVPDKSTEPLKPSGKYVRVKDREQTGNGEPGSGTGSGNYRRAEQPKQEPVVSGTGGKVVDHAAVKVHVGRCKGLELRDLNRDQVDALIQHWLGAAKANPKPSADDKRLMAALDWFMATQTDTAKPAEDDLPY